MTDTAPKLEHGHPKVTRDDRHGFDRYEWENGLLLFLYDDGRVKLGCWKAAISVVDVSNFTAGQSKGSSHVIARFTKTEGATSERG